MIKIVKGDITTLEVDAIVNPANEMMLGNAPKNLVSEGNFAEGEPEVMARPKVPPKAVASQFKIKYKEADYEY